jgi:hypothetical protein
LLAGIAGGVIVPSRMKVLGPGVMVALALIPSMAIVGMGRALGLTDLALGAASRWVVEVLCVVAGGGVIILLKRKVVHRRPDAQKSCSAHTRVSHRTEPEPHEANVVLDWLKEATYDDL